jgi:hypothetical protein
MANETKTMAAPNQFRPSDLALIVGANSMFQNIGKACELVQLVVPGERYTAPNGITYEHADPACWVVTGDGLCRWYEDGTVEQSDWGLCEPRHLRPLGGDFQPDRQKSREVMA